MSWADTDVGFDAPEVGTLNLNVKSPLTLPPLAVVFDDAPVNRAIARRLVNVGFPTAWFTHDEKNAVERGERLRGTKARTPRHAAEVAAYLPRGASKAGGDDEGNSPHHSSNRASRTTLRALDVLDVSDQGLDTGRRSQSARSTNPFRRSYSIGTEHTIDELADDVYDARDEYINDESSNYESENNPLLVVFAVSGDAEMESGLERLLAGEKASSSKYVDRALLAGAVVVVSGPISDVCADRVRKRCTRAGVRLVATAVEGDARQAMEGSLKLWIGSNHRTAVQAALPIFKAMGCEAEIVSTDPRDAACVRLAKATRGAPRETTGVASLRVTGATAAAVAAERRAISLEKQLEALKQTANDSDKNKKRAMKAESAAHEADQRAVDAMERNAALRVEVDLKTKEVARLAATCSEMDKHLHMCSDEKSKEIDALRMREIETNELINELKSELAAAHSNAATRVSNLNAEKKELELRIKRHEEATSRDAENLLATSASAENRLRTSLDEALDAQKAERLENTRLKEKLERLESVRRDFDELSRRADQDVADAEDRADAATRRAEKAENAVKRRDEKTQRIRDERAAARDAEAATRRELETVKSALAAANAKRDADAALARESADREAALAVAASDIARADAEARARKAHDHLTEANRRKDAAESDVRRLMGELAGVRDELKAHVSTTHVVSRLEIELAEVKHSLDVMEREKLRLERVVVEAHAERNAIVAAATATAEREAVRQREVATEASRLRLEAEAAGYRAARERDALSASMRLAKEQVRSSEIAEQRARRELAAERVAGEAAHAALADIGHETSRLAGEIEDARLVAQRTEQGRRRAAEAAGAEASAVLRDALEEAGTVASPRVNSSQRPLSSRGRKPSDDFVFDSSLHVDSPSNFDAFASPSPPRNKGGY